MTNVNGATEIDTRRSGRVGAADRLKRLYIIALGLIALLTIVSQLVIQRALMTQESDALVINVAGRQRMLSQELAKTALAVDEVLDHCYDEQTESFPDCDELVVRLANLGGALDLWTRSHAGLRHGDAELDLPGANSPEVTALFETVEPHYHAMREAVEELLEYDPKARSASVDQRVSQVLIPKIMEHEGLFLVGMNEIVLVYEAQARQRVSGLKRTALILMSVILLVLLLEAVLVFAPAARVIRRQFTQLRQSEEWLSTTLKSIGDAVIATDATGRVKFMNVVAEELTGWTHDDAAGKPVGEVFVIVKEATGEPAENPITKVLQEGVTVGLANHTALISKNGTRRPIDDSGAPIRDEQGQVLGAVLCFRDITERKQAEEALRQSETKFRSIFETVGNLITSVDEEGIIVECNNRVWEFLGYKKEEIIGRPMTW
ncbi:MAG: PAS domain S-box protein, partial [Planctomycetes bacterium]|nr:PAS domain S-box protein [Planctomycetota bacterium]